MNKQTTTTYTGTKKPKNANIAAFNGKLKDAIPDDTQYTIMINFLEYSANKFHEELTQHEELMEMAINTAPNYHKGNKGNFYTILGNTYGKKYKKHRKGANNAWYFPD